MLTWVVLKIAINFNAYLQNIFEFNFSFVEMISY